MRVAAGHAQLGSILHFAAVSSIRLLTMLQGTSDGFLQALDFECLLARNVGPSERETPA
jgi:hypothetical protein